MPAVAHAQISDPKPGQGAPAPALPDPVPTVSPQQQEPIVPDAEFEAALPKLSDDINAPLEPMQDFQAQPAAPAPSAVPTVPEVSRQIEQDFAPAAAEAPEFAEPLQPLAEFKVEPARSDDADEKAPTIRYTTVVEGLEKVRLEDRFRALSSLENGDGKAVNAAMVSARAREDEKLAVRLMQSLGYYDGTAISTIEQNPKNSGNVRATIAATPGTVYRLGTITIVSDPTVPPGLLDRELNLNPGDPIQADRVQGAEANVSLRLPQQGYPFVTLGERDILLDEETHIGDYTLPVTLGPRARFGKIVTEGRRRVFEADHIELLRRYKPGAIYDARQVDDLREALIATSLFSTISVEPQKTGQAGADGTEVVDLLVRQVAGRPRTIAAELGYSTGQGIRLEGSWTHRNLFPPEGALIGSGVLGTQEQGVTGTFRRSNAGLRDRTFQMSASLNHQDYAAFESYTGSLSARMSRDSTPIWQKRWTYYYGVELVGSNEDRYNFNTGGRDRGTWLIAALPMYGGYDSTDNLLNPTRGFRIKANVSPEMSVRVSARPYERFMLEGTAYYPVTGNIVIAGRARAGSIAGVARNDLPPSRRYYAGGGGSVRGFGYQELGPRSPDGRPVGGRSVNEFALEARYRFGNYGIVPFVDAGQVYEGIYPTGQNLRFGAGIGGRLYTNFGPIRVDVATPIARKPGESKISLYISIGQAF
nr:BamA/TamA family outer membrane protein [Sphingomonas sp. dw_22]